VSAMQAFTRRCSTHSSYFLRHSFISSTILSFPDLVLVSSKVTLFLNATHNTDSRNFICANITFFGL
jgi:hypothetical protein